MEKIKINIVNFQEIYTNMELLKLMQLKNKMILISSAMNTIQSMKKMIMIQKFEVILICILTTQSYFNYVSLKFWPNSNLKLSQVIKLKISKAIELKLNNILIEKDISLNKLASISCLTQSTVDSLINGKSQNPKLLTIVRICDGLGITLKEFFDDKLFDDIDREDQYVKNNV